MASISGIRDGMTQHAVILAVLSCVMFAVRPVSAQEVGVSLVFDTNKGASDSLQVGVTAQHAKYFKQPRGYRELVVEVSTNDGKPSPRDRVLTLDWEWRGVYRSATSRATTSVNLTRGQSTARFFVTIPALTFQDEHLQITVYETGRQTADIAWQAFGTPGAPSPSQDATMVLVVDDDATSYIEVDDRRGKRRTRIREYAANGNGRLLTFEALAQLFEVSSRGSSGPRPLSDPTEVDVNQGWYEKQAFQISAIDIRVFSPDRLPRDWRCLTSWTVIVLPAAELITMADGDRAQLNVLANWVQMGGRLVIADDAAHPELRTICEQVFLPGLSNCIWDQPPPELTLQEIVDRWSSSWQRQYSSTRDAAPSSIAAYPRQARSPTRGEQAGLPRELGSMRVGAGMLVIAPEDNLRANLWTWMWILSQPDLGTSALSRATSNSWYSQYDFHSGSCAEPAVGRMPFSLVGMLITTFLFVLGPINWIFVRRLGTRLFFVVTIPAISAVAMIVFITGALAFEGIGRRSSTRSITWLNQGNGTAASWSHQSYYSTFSLRQLSYPPSTFAAPFHLGQFWRNAGPLHHVESPQNTRISSSFLGARSLSLWRIGTIVQTQRRLVLQPAGPNRIAIRNTLGVPIDKLVIRDEDGAFYAASELKPNERRRLAAVANPDVALTELQDCYQGIVSDAFGALSYRGSYQVAANPPLLEQRCEAVVKSVAMPKRSYIAISTTTPSFVPLGATDTHPTPDVSIIVGQW